MVDLKANFKNKPAFRKDGWICEGCPKEVGTNVHVMSCETYQIISDGKDLEKDKDLVEFVRELLKVLEYLCIFSEPPQNKKPCSFVSIMH